MLKFIKGMHMRLTFCRRISICFNVMTYRDKHCKHSQEKGLGIFMRGYDAGLKDAKLDAMRAGDVKK